MKATARVLVSITVAAAITLIGSGSSVAASVGNPAGGSASSNCLWCDIWR